jgi:hypothetical protein
LTGSKVVAFGTPVDGGVAMVARVSDSVCPGVFLMSEQRGQIPRIEPVERPLVLQLFRAEILTMQRHGRDDIVIRR